MVGKLAIVPAPTVGSPSTPPPPAVAVQPSGADLERVLALQAEAAKERHLGLERLRALAKAPVQETPRSPRGWRCSECGAGIVGDVHLAGGATLCDRCWAIHRLHCDGVLGDGACSHRDVLTRHWADGHWRCDACGEALLALPEEKRPKRRTSAMTGLTRPGWP